MEQPRKMVKYLMLCVIYEGSLRMQQEGNGSILLAYTDNLSDSSSVIQN